MTIGPATFNTVAGNVDSPALERMQADGLSIFIFGDVVQDDGITSTLFEVALKTETLYEGCADSDGQPGVEVPNESPGHWDITMSLDRTLVNPELGLDVGAFRDAVIAADEDGEDGDNRVGMDEIDALVVDSGVTFGDQLRRQSATVVGHNGAGTCTSRPR